MFDLLRNSDLNKITEWGITNVYKLDSAFIGSYSIIDQYSRVLPYLVFLTLF